MWLSQFSLGSRKEEAEEFVGIVCAALAWGQLNKANGDSIVIQSHGSFRPKLCQTKHCLTTGESLPRIPFNILVSPPRSSKWPFFKQVFPPYILYAFVSITVTCPLYVPFENRVGVAGGWRRLHIEGFYNLYASPNVTRVITSRRMRLAGHVLHMGEMTCIQNFCPKTQREKTTYKT